MGGNDLCVDIVSKSCKPVLLTQQLRILESHYAELDSSHIREAITGLTHSSPGELFQLVPLRSAVDVSEAGSPEGRALRALLGTRPATCYWRKERLDSLVLRADSSRGLEALESQAYGDFALLRLGARLVSLSSLEVDNEEAFVAPSWVVLNHLLTHPHRLYDEAAPNVVAAGDFYLQEDGMHKCSMLLEIAYCCGGTSLYIDKVPTRRLRNRGLEGLKNGRYLAQPRVLSLGETQEDWHEQESRSMHLLGMIANSTGWNWEDIPSRPGDGVLVVHL